MRRIAAVALLLAGCSSTSAPEPDPADGIIEGNRMKVLGDIKGYHNDDPRVRVAAAGRIVNVTVTTYGGGCHSEGETKVEVRGSVADVIPYDYTALPGTACTQPLLSFEHDVVIPFATDGIATVRIHGIDRSSRSGDNMRGTRIVVERTVRLQ